MKAYIKNDLKQTFLILEGEEDREEDFRTSMLQGNEIPGLLKTSITYVDNKRHYHYDISGKISLKAKYEKTKLSGEDIRRLVYAILQVIREAKNFMLNTEDIILNEEYIYCEGEEYFFCYKPSCQLKLTEEFHKLTEYFVREVDYKDEEGIHLAYTLHKSSMEENYSIEKIMEKLEEEESAPPIRYDERMEGYKEEESTIAEKKEFWEPVRRFLERRKKEKWENWAEISENESDL